MHVSEALQKSPPRPRTLRKNTGNFGKMSPFLTIEAEKTYLFLMVRFWPIRWEMPMLGGRYPFLNRFRPSTARVRPPGPKFGTRFGPLFETS